MPIKMELGPDTRRGPGYGVLKITGLPEIQGDLEVSVQENQKGEFLTAPGTWQAQQAWISMPMAHRQDNTVQVEIGPDLVDSFAVLAPNVRLQATARLPEWTDRAPLMVTRDLIPSMGGGEGSFGPSGPGRITAVPPVREPVAVQELAPEPEPAPGGGTVPVSEDLGSREEVSLPPDRTGEIPRVVPKSAIAAGVVALLMLGGLGAAWGLGLIGGDPDPVPDQALASVVPDPEPEAQTTPPNEPVAVPPSHSAISTRDELKAYLQTNPDTSAAQATAKILVEGGKLDYAMLVYQYAARLGSTDASMAIARMYDPDTWSAQTSPMPQADAETAAYWYEPAAQANNAEAQRQLGKILAQSEFPFQRDQAKEWLGKAAQAGDAGAQALLESLK